MSTFSVATSKLGPGTGQIKLGGNSDEDSRARKRVRKAMGDLLEKGLCRIVVEASELEWASVDVLGAMTGDYLRAVEAGGGVAFAGLQGEARDFAEHLGLTQFAAVYPDVKQAKAALKQDSREDGELRDERLTLQTGQADGGVKVILPVGSLSEGNLGPVEEVFRQLLETKPAGVLIDGQRWLDVDSDGMALLLKFADQCAQAGIELHGAQVWGVVRTVFETLGLGPFVKLFPTPEEALAAFSQA